MGDDPDLGWSGILLDDIEVVSGTTTVFADGAETTPNGWTLDGFSSVGATYTADFAHYYLASYRTYVSYDSYLRTGPYNFGFAPERPNLVEHFPYQDGLLVNYWDTAYSDNNTSKPPGHGLILPVDSHPRTHVRADGEPWQGRIQIYDAPFGWTAPTRSPCTSRASPAGSRPSRLGRSSLTATRCATTRPMRRAACQKSG